MAKTDNLFSQMLLSTGVLLPVDVKSKNGKVSAMCRLVQGRDKEWTVCADKMLRAAESASAELLVCRRFLLKNGEMVQGIYVCLEGKSSSLPGLISAISEALPQTLDPVTGPKPKDDKASAMSYTEYKKMTSAHPRKMSEPGRADIPPPGFKPEIRTIAQSVGPSGKMTVIEEVPIPHIHREMNVPNSKGRGAKLLGG